MPSLLEMLGYMLQGGVSPRSDFLPTEYGKPPPGYQFPSTGPQQTLQIPQQIPSLAQPVDPSLLGPPPSPEREALQAPDIDPIDIATSTIAFGGPAFNTLSALALGAGSHYLDQPASVMAHAPRIGVGGGPTKEFGLFEGLGLFPEAPVTGMIPGGGWQYGSPPTVNTQPIDPVMYSPAAAKTVRLNPIEDPKLPLPKYMYHGLGVGSWDLREPSKVALEVQKQTLQNILPVPGIDVSKLSKEDPYGIGGGLTKGWFSDKPLPGYGPVYLAVKTEDLPQHGSWGNPHAKNFPGSGEAQFYTYRPWDFDPSQPVESLQTAVERGGAGPVPPSKIMLADRTGKIIAPIESEEAQTYLKNMGKKLTEILYSKPKTGMLPTWDMETFLKLLEKSPK